MHFSIICFVYSRLAQLEVVALFFMCDESFHYLCVKFQTASSGTNSGCRLANAATWEWSLCFNICYSPDWELMESADITLAINLQYYLCWQSVFTCLRKSLLLCTQLLKPHINYIPILLTDPHRPLKSCSLRGPVCSHCCLVIFPSDPDRTTQPRWSVFRRQGFIMLISQETHISSVQPFVGSYPLRFSDLLNTLQPKTEAYGSTNDSVA